jgi:hypothetical protein
MYICTRSCISRCTLCSTGISYVTCLHSIIAFLLYHSCTFPVSYVLSEWVGYGYARKNLGFKNVV